MDIKTSEEKTRSSIKYSLHSRSFSDVSYISVPIHLRTNGCKWHAVFPSSCALVCLVLGLGVLGGGCGAGEGCMQHMQVSIPTELSGNSALEVLNCCLQIRGQVHILHPGSCPASQERLMNLRSLFWFWGQLGTAVANESLDQFMGKEGMQKTKTN